MNKKVLIGIGVGVIVVGIFLLVVTNPNLRENKDTYFGLIETSSTFDCAQTWDDMVAFSANYSNTGLDLEQISDLDNAGKELGETFFKNKCVSKMDDWWHEIEDPVGHNLGMNNPGVREIWLEEEITRNMEIP